MRRSLVLAFVLALGASARAQPAAPIDARCYRASVLVTVDGGTGSGTIVDPRGFVLTNHHVVAPVLVPGFDGPSVRGGAHLRVQIPDPHTLEATDVWEAEIVAANPEIDLALVRIVGRPGEPPRADVRFDAMSIANGEALAIGTRVSVLGYPFGNRILTVLSGTITGLRVQTDGTVDWMTTDAPFNPGNSGGTVVDAECRLVGVPTQVYRGGLNPVNMARPIDTRVRAYVDGALALAIRRHDETTGTVPTFGSSTSVGVAPSKPPAHSRRRRASR